MTNKNIDKAVSAAKVIATWASYYGSNYNSYSREDHVQNLTNIEQYAKEIVDLLIGNEASGTSDGNSLR